MLNWKRSRNWETFHNFTISDTSPLITYSPYIAANGLTGGWESVCPNYETRPDGQKANFCEPESEHVTSSSKASLRLNFEGTGIYLMGSTTNSLGYDITLDGVQSSGNPDPDLQLLYSATRLKAGSHSITLTVREPASSENPGSVTFKSAIMQLSTSRDYLEMYSEKLLKDDDPGISYAYPLGGNWTIEDNFRSLTDFSLDGGVTSHQSNSTNATATISFQGNTVFVYGSCYSTPGSAPYAASMDGAPETSYDGAVNLYTTNGVEQRTAKCLQYFKTGLDPTQNHKLVLRVKEAGRLSIDWLRVGRIEKFEYSGNPLPHSPPSLAAILAGSITSSVVSILVMCALTIFCCRRRKRRREKAEREKNLSQLQNSTAGYYVTQYYPNPGPGPNLDPNPNPNPDLGLQLQMSMPVHSYNTGPIMPPWPQPQTPAPGASGAGIGLVGMTGHFLTSSPSAHLPSTEVATAYPEGPDSHRPVHPESSYNNHAPQNENSEYKATYNPNTPTGADTGTIGLVSDMPVRSGGSISQIDAASSLRHGTVSPGPPAYDQMSFMAPAPASGGR